MSLTEPELPRQSSVLDPGPGGGSSASVVTGDEDMFGLALGHTSSHHTDTNFADQLDRYPGPGVGTLQVVDQLRQILNIEIRR